METVHVAVLVLGAAVLAGCVEDGPAEAIVDFDPYVVLQSPETW